VNVQVATRPQVRRVRGIRDVANSHDPAREEFVVCRMTGCAPLLFRKVMTRFYNSAEKRNKPGALLNNPAQMRKLEVAVSVDKARSENAGVMLYVSPCSRVDSEDSTIISHFEGAAFRQESAAIVNARGGEEHNARRSES
jgi:hypothetical protein